MNLTVRYAGLSVPGRVRSKNEDAWTADPQQGLFIVADGMGGEFAGALASKAVVATLPGLVQQQFSDINELTGSRAKRRMMKAIARLSMQLNQQTRNEPGLAGMGSTVVCVLVRADKALVAHMGDSRVYRLQQGKLKQLTKDHTLVQLLIDSGDIKPEEAATHPACGRLTRNVGMEGEPLPEARLLKLNPGDLLLLCTDGLTGMVSDQQIEAVLDQRAPMETLCRRLIDAANEAGGKDNVTAMLLRFESDKRQPRTKNWSLSRSPRIDFG